METTTATATTARGSSSTTTTTRSTSSTAGKLGIWLFLAQEVLFFSALFVAYILYRVHHREIYCYAHKWLDVKYGRDQHRAS